MYASMRLRKPMSNSAWKLYLLLFCSVELAFLAGYLLIGNY